MNNKSLKLIDSTYSASDAKVVLVSLLEDKINFLCGRRFSRLERNDGDCSHLDRRIEELKRDKEELIQFLQGMENENANFEISCDINLKQVENNALTNLVEEALV